MRCTSQKRIKLRNSWHLLIIIIISLHIKSILWLQSFCELLWRNQHIFWRLLSEYYGGKEGKKYVKEWSRGMCVFIGACDSVTVSRWSRPYGLWLPHSLEGVHGAVWQCVNLAGFNGIGRQQPTALHSHINSTSACLPSFSSKLMNLAYELEKPTCLRTYSSSQVLQNMKLWEKSSAL